MNDLIRNGMTAVVAMVLMSWSVGCCSADDTIKFRVDVQLNETVRDSATGQYPAVDVDLIGVYDDRTFAKWSEASMTKYWEVENPYDAHHGDMVYPIQLGSYTAKPLKSDDAIWDRWKAQGVKYIFVMSSYPTKGDDRPGASDSRRNIIPIQCLRWDPKPDVVTVTIKGHGVSFTPTPKAEVK